MANSSIALMGLSDDQALSAIEWLRGIGDLLAANRCCLPSQKELPNEVRR